MIVANLLEHRHRRAAQYIYTYMYIYVYTNINKLNLILASPAEASPPLLRASRAAQHKIQR